MANNHKHFFYEYLVDILRIQSLMFKKQSFDHEYNLKWAQRSLKPRTKERSCEL